MMKNKLLKTIYESPKTIVGYFPYPTWAMYDSIIVETSNGNVIYSRYMEKVEKEKREKQVMLDLWNMATKGKQVVLCVGNSI